MATLLNNTTIGTEEWYKIQLTRHVLPQLEKDKRRFSWSKRKMPDEKNDLKQNLQTFLNHCTEADRRRFTQEAWHQCVNYALSDPPYEPVIDERERQALFEIAQWLDLPKDDERRQILGPRAHSLRDLQDDEIKNVLISNNIPQEFKTTFGNRWNERISQEMFALASRVQEQHEDVWKEGKGFLHNVQQFTQIVLPKQPICDEGICVLSKEYQDKEIYFIGDIHGDIDALDAVLECTKFSSGTDVKGPCLIFLGDYGDRGLNTMDVWIRLLQLKSKYSNRVFLLRGNHEDFFDVRLTLTENGQEIKAPFKIPAVAKYWDTFASLYYLLQGVGEQISNIPTFCDALPSMIIMPDGLLALHGGPLPRRRKNDGWTLPEDSYKPLEVKSLFDLRKPRVQFLMRWSEPDEQEKDDFECAWSEYKGQIGPRLTTSKADIQEFLAKTGLLRIVHGHSHPNAGYRSLYGGLATCLKTTRYANGDSMAIARYIPHETVQPIEVKV